MKLESPVSSPSIAPLTGVRGFAALWVVFYHLRPAFRQLMSESPDNYLLQFIGRGYLGVDLFAFLSGFIISYTYTNRLYQWNVSAALQFIWLRLGRIYPLHLFVLFLFAAMYYIKNGLSRSGNIFSDMAFIRQLFLLNGSGLETQWSWNVPSWSLSAEWLCYLLFPIFLPLIARVNNGYIALILAVAAFLMTAMILRFLGYPDFSASLDGGFVRIGGEIITGCFLYRMYVSQVFRHWPFSLIGFLALATMFAVVLSYPVATVFTFAIFVFSLSQPSPVINNIFGNRFCVYLGEISFSIYMIHWFVISNVAYWGLTKIYLPVLIPLLFILIISISGLLYEFIEKPARFYLRKAIS